MNNALQWLFIFCIGCLIIQIGSTGTLGRVVAVAFVPGDLVVN